MSSKVDLKLSEDLFLTDIDFDDNTILTDTPMGGVSVIALGQPKRSIFASREKTAISMSSRVAQRVNNFLLNEEIGLHAQLLMLGDKIHLNSRDEDRFKRFETNCVKMNVAHIERMKNSVLADESLLPKFRHILKTDEQANKEDVIDMVAGSLLRQDNKYDLLLSAINEKRIIGEKIYLINQSLLSQRCQMAIAKSSDEGKSQLDEAKSQSE